MTNSRDTLELLADHFRAPQIFSADARPVGEPVLDWLGYLSSADAHARVRLALSQWEFWSAYLPKFHALLQAHLVDVVYAAHADEPHLLIYRVSVDGHDGLYQGRPPLSRAEQPYPMPSRLTGFYGTLHGGFGLVPFWRGGPLPPARLYMLDTHEWGWLEDDPKWAGAREDGRLANRLAIFDNGAGDTIAIDTTAKTSDTPVWAWFDDEAPEPSSLWPLLDAWMEMMFPGRS